MTNYAVSRIAGAVGVIGTFCAMMGFLGAFMSTSSVFTTLAVCGTSAVFICQFFITED